MKPSLIMFFALIISGCSVTDSIAKYSYFLDAPGGSYSEWNYLDIPENSIVSIKGRFTINRSTEDWRSHASFKVFDASQNSGVGLGITFSESDTYNLYLFSHKRKEKGSEIIRSEPVYFSNTIEFEKEFELSIQWKSKDELRVVLNSKEEQAMELPFVPEIFSLTSSSGELTVSEMLISKM